MGGRPSRSGFAAWDSCSIVPCAMRFGTWPGSGLARFTNLALYHKTSYRREAGIKAKRSLTPVYTGVAYWQNARLVNLASSVPAGLRLYRHSLNRISDSKEIQNLMLEIPLEFPKEIRRMTVSF